MTSHSWLHCARILIVAIMLLGSGLLSVPAQAEDETEASDKDIGYNPVEVLVKLFDETTLLAVAAEYGLNPNPIEQFGNRPIYTMQIIDGAKPPNKAEALEADIKKRVQFAEPNYRSQAPESRQRSIWAIGGSPGQYVNQWAGNAINLNEAHRTTRGAGVTVAVIDTGVDFRHPDLRNRLLPGFDFVDYDNDPSEVGLYGKHHGFGHGTHVAGLVAFAAPEARIMPIRALTAEGIGNTWVLAEALAYAVDPDCNPKTKDGAHVINLSLSAPHSSKLIETLIEEIMSKPEDDNEGEEESIFPEGDIPGRACQKHSLASNALVVAAVGNEGAKFPQYPAALQGDGMRVLAVAASTVENTRASFSNYGSWVNIAAPGENILSTIPLSSGAAYGTWSGTSMATPLVAGTAALVKAKNPLLRSDALMRHIISTAAPLSSREAPHRIDAAKAVQKSPSVLP